MTRNVCSGCFYTYFPEEGFPEQQIPPGTTFADLPADWVCPDCGLPKEDFREFIDKNADR